MAGAAAAGEAELAVEVGDGLAEPVRAQVAVGSAVSGIEFGQRPGIVDGGLDLRLAWYYPGAGGQPPGIVRAVAGNPRGVTPAKLSRMPSRFASATRRLIPA